MSTFRPFRKTLRPAASCRTHTPIAALSGKGGGNAANHAAVVVLRTVAIAITLAALCLAGPQPGRAQTPIALTPGAPAPDVAIASTALQNAIRDFAATPNATTAGAVSSAQSAYNEAVSREVGTGPVFAPGRYLFSSAGVVSTATTVGAGEGLVIFANPSGSLTFTGIAAPAVRITGSSFLGPSMANFNTVGVNPASLPLSFTFRDNGFSVGGTSGGAISNSGTATIANSSFMDDTARFGGGAINNQSGGTMTIANSIFEGDSQEGGHGGAIVNSGTMTIANSSFEGDKSTAGGGAIYDGGTETIANSSFTNNTALQFGGAIYKPFTQTLTIANSSFSGNSAASSGGAIYNVGTLNLNVSAGQTSTFSGNTAAGQSSSIFFSVGALDVDLAAGGLLDMRDPMSRTSTSTEFGITETGKGVWALGGANSLDRTAFRANGSTLYLYAAGQVPNPTHGAPGARVAAGMINLMGGAFNSFTLGSGATLVAAGNNTISAGTITSPGTITIAGGATIRGGTGNDASLLNVPLSAGGGPTSSLTLTATPNVVDLEGHLTVQAVAAGDGFTLRGAPLAGGGSLIVNSNGAAGTVILTEDNSYTGGTTLKGGTLLLSGATLGSVDGRTTVENGATLNLGTTTQTQNGGVTLIAGTIENGTLVSDSLFDVREGTISAELEGGAKLAKTGPGTVTLSGTNIYIGGTFLNEGTLSVESNGNLGAGAGALNFNGGILQVRGTSFTSTLRVINWGPSGGGFDIADAANTFTLSNSHPLTGVGPLTKLGAGTLVLTQNNTYSGATRVSAGALQAAAMDVFSPNSAFTVAGGATLNLENLNQKIGSLAGAGSVTLGSATLTTGNDNTSTIFSGVISGTGALQKVGAGTFTLSGANTYSGGTTITAGTVQLGNGGTTGGILGNVTNNGTLAFNRSDTVIFPGLIEGTGSVAQIGSGTSILTATNTYSGGTIISAGTLQLGNGGTTGGILGNVTNNGTLAFNRSDTITFPGIISGTGSVAQIGSGRTILAGLNTYSGGTIFEAGILAVEGNGHLGTGPLTFNGGILEDLTGANLLSDVAIELGPAGGTFLADPDSTSTLKGTISGPGSFTKTGLGTLILTGNNTFSGGTTIDEGTLVVGVPAGSSSLTSFALGTGNVFLNGGTLRTTSLDPQPLTINVGGNYTQGPVGTLALGIGGLNGSQYDHVQVGGNAFLNGTLAVSSLNGFRPVSINAFQVLHSNGTRSGQFAQVEDSFNNNPNLFRSDIYFANAVVLLYKAPPALPATIVSPSRIPPPDPDAPLSLSFLVKALNPTTEELTSLFEVAFSGANIQRFNLDDRMTQIQRSLVVPPPAPPPAPPTGKEAVTGKEEVGKAPPPPTVQPGPRWGVWANGWGDWVHVNSTGSAQGYHFTTGGMSAGVDYLLTDHLAVGLFGGYSHTWVDFKPGSADVDTGRGGLYATYFNPTGWWVNAGVWGGYNSYSTNRHALETPANGSTDGYEISTFGEAGYNFHCGNLTWGPLVAMQYTDVHVSGFSEHGSLIPLDIHSKSQDSLRTDVGAQASYNWHLGKTTVIPGLKLAWEHEYRYSNLDISGSAPDLNGASATFNGPNLGHDSLLINANIGIQCSSRIAITIGYDGQLARERYDSHAVTGTFSFSF